MDAIWDLGAATIRVKRRYPTNAAGIHIRLRARTFIVAEPKIRIVYNTRKTTMRGNWNFIKPENRIERFTKL